MDNFVQNILKQWGLEVLIHNFNEHAVDEKTFYSLNEDAIKEIIPQWGWRNKFSNKYVIFNKESELQQTCSFDVDRLSHRLRKSFPNLTENPELFLPSTSTDIYVSKIRSVPPSRAISLKSFLRSCLRGNIILQTYKNHSTVDRSLLCGMIIERELDSNVNYKITKERFLELTDSICELFPTEERDLYYIPSTRHESLSVNARGSLYNSYNEWRRLIAQAGLLKNLEIEVTAEQSPEPENDDVNWLKNNFEPINDIISKWKATYDHRLEWTNKTIDEYFDTFPCLKGPEGYKLLLLDFDHNYESKRDSLITKWPDIAKKIMKFTAKKGIPTLKLALKN